MARQLDETKRDRELQNQPLPWVSQIEVLIEKPRFFYSPPDKSYQAMSRYGVNFALKNIGNHPAVCTDVTSRIEIPQEDKALYLDAVSVSVETLEEKQKYPYEKEHKKGFLFADDAEGKMLKALRENDLGKYPRLRFRILYRNVLGGCFVLYNEYLLCPETPEQDSILKNWLSQITSFPIHFKKDLDSLKELKGLKDKRWEELFDRVKAQFADSLNGEDIKLFTWSIPGTFMVRTLSNEEYLKAIKNISYGRIMHPQMIVCPAIDNNKNQ
jgi:hypothetical protein